MVVSANGYGKRSALEDYRVTNRGGKGVMTLKVTDKTGELVAIKNVTDENDLMIINQSGVTLRLPVNSIRVTGRATQGVKLIDLGKRGDTIASVCKVDANPEEDVEKELSEEEQEARQTEEEIMKKPLTVESDEDAETELADEILEEEEGDEEAYREEQDYEPSEE